MKSIVGKSVTVVLLLAVASGLAAWLVFGDKISAALSGEPQTVSPLTAPVERGSVQQTVTGVGEVKPLETVKLRPADSWHWLQSFDAPLNKRVAAGEDVYKRQYQAFLEDDEPDFDAAFDGKTDKVYSMSLLNAPADASGDEDFDYDAFLGRFSHVLEMRPFDVKRVGNYGFLFLETDPSTSDELDFLCLLYTSRCV